MAKPNLMKKHCRETLMNLCETCALNDITVAQFLEAANIARQTFYNHFSDMSDLIAYTASWIVVDSDDPLCSPASARNSYEFALQHRGFFGQLHTHTGQNNYRDAMKRYLRETNYRLFLTDELDEEERLYRKACIDVHYPATVDTFLDWAASGMKVPADVMVRALYDSAAPFIQETCRLTPTHAQEWPR